MKIKACKSKGAQAKGLMFSRKKNLLFVFDKPKYVDLHMLFVFFKVDAIYVNENMEIIEIKHMKPFRMLYRARHKAKYIIEVTDGHNFKIWDRVVIKGDEIRKEV